MFHGFSEYQDVNDLVIRTYQYIYIYLYIYFFVVFVLHNSDVYRCGTLLVVFCVWVEADAGQGWGGCVGGLINVTISVKSVLTRKFQITLFEIRIKMQKLHVCFPIEKEK